MFFTSLKKLEKMRQRSKPFMGILRFLSLRELDRKDRGWQPNTRESEGHADEGWQINKEVVLKFCADFADILFETVVKSVWPSARVKGLQPKKQVGTWQLISVDVDCETSADVSMIVERLLKHECARICSGYVCYDSIFGLVT